jgi:hypothetical protein
MLIENRKRLLHQCHVILSPGIWKAEVQKRFGCPVRYNVGRIGEEAVFIAPMFRQLTTAD